MCWDAAAWEFETERLRVLAWGRRGDHVLIEFLLAALTGEVTRELPPSWQRGLSDATAHAWIAEREAQGSMFLVEARTSGLPLGVFMFFPGEATRSEGEVRLGYVLAESAWGQGYATEVVNGFLRRWDERGVTATLMAGVTPENVASQRVLEKAGFTRAGSRDGVLEYRRRPASSPTA